MKKHCLLVLALVVALVVPMASAETPDLDPSLVRDGETYAAEVGVELAEAVRRLQLQGAVGDLHGQLALKEWDSYAGLWIEHTPDEYRVVARFTHDGEETLRSYVEGSPLAAELLEARPADATLGHLENVQLNALLAVQHLGVRVESGINVKTNRVELYVIERDSFDRGFQKSNVRLPDFVDVITVEHLSEQVADIFGGKHLSTCTSGFSVKNSSGTKGITTAAHCGNTQYYSGTSLPFKGSALGCSCDVQWHTAPGFTVRNLAWDGSSNRYIYGTKSRGSMVVGDYVCKYGKTTKYGCGWIENTSYKRTDSGSWCSTWIRVGNPSYDLSEGGDSGGPWFLGNTAYGTMATQIGWDATFMASNYINSCLGLTVLTY